MKRGSIRWKIVVLAWMIGISGMAGDIGRIVALASTSDNKTITDVKLTVYSKLEAGETLPSIDYNNSDSDGSVDSGDICVTNSSSQYSITDAEWVTSTSKTMDVGDTPTMKVTLSPNSTGSYDYEFKGSYKSSNVTIKKGTFVSASKSSGKLIVKLKVREIEGTFGEPEDVYWKDNTMGTAKWDEPDEGSTGKYQVELKRGGSKVYSTTTTARTFNFYPYMTKAGMYTFRVRTIAKTSDDEDYGKSSDWVESDELEIAEEDVSDGTGQESASDGAFAEPGTGTTGNTTVGWQYLDNSWYYYYPDGTYATGGWLDVGGANYLFGSDGKMLTGWQNQNNQTYYIEDSGEMRTGWITWNGQWYYANETQDEYLGCLLKERWLILGDKTYYLTATGQMAEGWVQVDGNWYYFYPGSGEKAYNTWVGTFYVDENGVWNK
ncbi:MAG: N-acetylmuramoyl-L-alanine amidase family protein [Clostridiales bacterium]|nr:N-acetylmuramoyl-L-alanine amidase family protein [Clostridiales bacterium]